MAKTVVKITSKEIEDILGDLTYDEQNEVLEELKNGLFMD